MFAVVELINSEMESTGEISVVPLMWLLTNQTRCYWPISTNKVPFKKFVQCLTPFKKSWPIYRIKNHFTSATYEETEQHLNNLLTDNYESTDSTKTCQKSVLNSSNESDDSENVSPNTPALSEVSKRLHCVISTPSSISKDGIAQKIIRLSAASESSFMLDGESTSRPTSIISSSSICTNNHGTSSRNPEFENVVLHTLSKISACVEQHSILLVEINRRTSLTVSDNLIPPDDLPDFPFYLLLSFQEFETRLSNDSNLWNFMVRRLASLGGSGAESHTRRVLRFILSDEVAQQFNWKGRDKLSFEKLKTKNLIIAAVRDAFPSKEIDEFKLCNVMKEWLKFVDNV